MVKNCSNAYPIENMDKYSEYFNIFPYPLSDFQKYAIEAIVTGQHTLVTAHTGSGKTLPAEFAIQHFVGMGKKVIYTSPIKALSNQKYYEFTKKYPHISFGLFTGDIKTNPDADVLIMTTEILMNYLFTSTINKTAVEKVSGGETRPDLQFQIDIDRDLACVVFDEVHYINDKERGQTWEKTILMLPPHIQMVMLSATIDNPTGFASWCERGMADEPGGKQVYLASTNYRVVPLSHYGFLTTTEAIFKTVKDKVIEKLVRDTTNTLLPLQDHNGGFKDSGFNDIIKINKIFDTNRVDMKRKHVLNQLSLFLRERDMLPAIAFVFSRKNVELYAQDITVPLLEFDSKVGYTVRHECEQIIRKLPNYTEYLELPEYNQLVNLLEKGIGIHHSGMIPVLREIVELMISKKYIKLLFATESFAIGLDCPIKTTVFTSLTKFDGNTERYLMSHEYTQMAGRAGRRGIDTIGHVVHCNNLFATPTLTDYKAILCGTPQKLVSKFHISYSLILNLLKNGQTCDFHDFSQKSMVHNELLKSIQNARDDISQIESAILSKRATIQLARTPESVCLAYIDLETKCKNSVNKKKRDAEKEMRTIEADHRFLTNDLKYVKELATLEDDLEYSNKCLQYSTNYIKDQTDRVCKVMIDDGFVEAMIESPEDNDITRYGLTTLGKIASNIAEIHPLILSQQMIKWQYFSEFSSKQMVGLFSCFTDIKINSDDRASVPLIDDLFLKSKINEVIGLYQMYDSKEADYDIHTGLKYDNALMFDMIDFAMTWCDCETETDCKMFIQNTVASKSISIGDFNKAMLKIVTISKELMNLCEQIGQIELLYKLGQIEGMVLKYVTTSQSLYV